MRRREFITLGSAAAAWPLAARAQQRERMRRIGVLMSATPDDPYQTTYLSAFMQGLQERGWTIGRNVRIDPRWGAGLPRPSYFWLHRPVPVTSLARSCPSLAAIQAVDLAPIFELFTAKRIGMPTSAQKWLDGSYRRN